MPRIKADTYTRILSAALAIFSERGFAAATTRQIADLAQVNQPLIAYYFSSKEDLWKAAVDLSFAGFDETLSGLLTASKTMPIEPAAVVRAFVGCVAANPEWVAFMSRAVMTTDDRTDWLLEKWIKPQTAKAYLLLTGQRIDPDDGDSIMRAVSLTWMMAGPTTIFAQREQLTAIAGTDVRSPEFVERFADMLVASIEHILPLVK